MCGVLCSLGFAYDWIDNNILWSTSDILQKGAIRIFSMDRFAHTDLYANLDNPTYVNVNPLNRLAIIYLLSSFVDIGWIMKYVSCLLFNFHSKILLKNILFVWVYVPRENFSLIWRRHHYWLRVAIFYLCSTLAAIEL